MTDRWIPAISNEIWQYGHRVFDVVRGVITKEEDWCNDDIEDTSTIGGLCWSWSIWIDRFFRGSESLVFVLQRNICDGIVWRRITGGWSGIWRNDNLIWTNFIKKYSQKKRETLTEIMVDFLYY